MDDNKDIEKVSRTVFDKFRREAPDSAWNKLDADLDKRQNLAYKRRANRFKLLSILLLLFIFFSFTWEYLIPSSATKHTSGVTPPGNKIADTVSENNRKAAVNAEQGNSSISYSASEVKSEFVKSEDKINNTINKSGKALTLYASAKTKKHYRAKRAGNEKQNSNAALISDGNVVNGNALQSNPVNDNLITSEAVNGTAVADSINISEQTISTAEINAPGTTLSSVTDSGKSEPVNFVKSDSLIKPGKIKSRFSLAGFYAPNKTWCNLKDNTADNFDDAAMYNNRENSEYSYSAGITLKYDLSSKWGLITGVTYATMTKSMTVGTMYANTNAGNEMHFEYATSNGMIEMPHDDAHPSPQQGDSINMNADCLQSVEFISVPLAVRYQLTNKKFVWYADAGLSANFIIAEKAKIKMDNSETVVVNNINGLKKINYGYLLGAGVQYNVDNDFGIFIEPVFRGSFTSITHGTAVNSYPYSLGLNLGFSFRF
ncbi:MAG: outer membrane beta-barrel protein [Bacteroidia bacterium]